MHRSNLSFLAFFLLFSPLALSHQSIQEKNAQILAYNQTIHDLDLLYKKAQEPVFRASPKEIDNVLRHWALNYDNTANLDNGNAILSLLSISTRIHSKPYYKIFLDKAYRKVTQSDNKNSLEISRNQNKTLINLTNFGRGILKNDPLTDAPWDQSIGSFLTNRTFVDYNFLQKLGLIKPSTDVMGNRVLLMDDRNILSHHLANVLNQLSFSTQWQKYKLSRIPNSNIIWDVMRSISLYAKQDRYFRVDLSVEKPKEQEGSILKGYYLSATKSISVVVGNVGKDLDPMLFSPEIFRSTIVHEFTHQIMDVFYQNSAKPYPEGNLHRRNEYENVISALTKSLQGKLRGDRRLDYKNFKSTGNKSLDYVKKRMIGVLGGDLYESDQHHAEIIVLLPEVIAGGYYEDAQVRKFLQPLTEYWQTYIAPDIYTYTQKTQQYYDFVFTGDKSFPKTSSFLSSLLQRDATTMSYRKINNTLDELYAKWIEIYSGRADRLKKLPKIFKHLSTDPSDKTDYSKSVFTFLQKQKDPKLLNLYSSLMYNQWLKTKNKDMLDLYNNSKKK